MDSKIPKVGDIIYVESAGYSDSPWRDTVGGKARIVKVEKRESTYWITVEQFPERSYNWDFLEGMQDYLKKEAGDQWASHG